MRKQPKITKVRVTVHTKAALEKYRGIGNPGIPSGKKGINRWLREMRGHID